MKTISRVLESPDKARLFKTAVVVADVETFKEGDIVAVAYVGVADFGAVYRISANHLPNRVEAKVYDRYLDRFTL